MAIVFSGAKAAIRTAIDTYFGPIPSSLSSADQASISAQRDNLASIIATACTYVQANAVVHTNDTGTVTSGAGSGGAVVATGIGTLT
jgi:AICAR transformylase/IMP cyclohydrolase PurH